MSRLSLCHLCKETQTVLSAFFCLRGKPVARVMPQVVAAFLLVVVSSAHTRALEENKPAVHLTSVSIKTVDWNRRTAQTELSITIDNAGPAFKLKDLSYRLKLNEKQAAVGKYDKEIEVPARSSAAFNLPCKVDLSALPGVAWAVVAGGFDVHYELEAEFTVPLFSPLSPRIKTSIGGDISLVGTVSGWTARIKEGIASM